ncbi:cytochrome c oxidase subunit 4 [Sinomonas terrae]|uniref:Cytochrome c oxidase polypeptide 4 n=1 Tax=Sinomonas terrae TaxID=2908838 RepID=A0ABS9U0W5_9MICC|nr:cytochrome c oxidase subunit 4 [Sinomonas terrae]MCH6470334.1 cytochrome c oxidase subunit 4 [Sinomonas terrae]
MKVESWLFGTGIFFFFPVAIVYGWLTHWSEWVGIMGIFLLGGLAGMIGSYLGVTSRRVGARPEDREDAEVHEGAGEQGHFSPWSWWPIVLGASAATALLGVAIGWWITLVGAGIGIVALVGWVFEYSRGDHAH